MGHSTQSHLGKVERVQEKRKGAQFGLELGFQATILKTQDRQRH